MTRSRSLRRGTRLQLGKHPPSCTSGRRRDSITRPRDSTFVTICATTWALTWLGAVVRPRGIHSEGGREVGDRSIRRPFCASRLRLLRPVTISVALLQHPGESRGGAAATQASVNVAVIPGFTPPTYPGFYGVPAFPTKAPQLAAYHFSQLATGKVTSSALSSYDTVNSVRDPLERQSRRAGRQRSTCSQRRTKC